MFLVKFANANLKGRSDKAETKDEDLHDIF